VRGLSSKNTLPGRATPLDVVNRHAVTGRPIKPPFPDGFARALFGMGCFWGAERLFWSLPGVYTTAVGYAGGVTPNASYAEVCTGKTGHAEVVLVVYDPGVATLASLLRVFWEGHDPTQGMRQGNDVGAQYRSAIYVFDEVQRAAAERSLEAYQTALFGADRRATITTEIRIDQLFYYAEDLHQQYLAKNPHGYCGLGGTGVRYPAAPQGAAGDSPR
jgi:peptide-methionine (S)-S-oxide reductase